MAKGDGQGGVVGAVSEHRERHQRVPGQSFLAEEEEANHQRAEDDQADHLRTAPGEDGAAEVETEEQHERHGEHGEGAEPVYG